MRCVDKIPAWPVWDQIARAHHDASNISDGGPVARLKDRYLPHSCEGSHQLVRWIGLFSLNVLFSGPEPRNLPFMSHKLCIHIHVDARERARAGKVWSEGANGEWDWREKHAPWACEAPMWSPRAQHENIDHASASHLAKPILRKVRMFCSLRGLLTKYSDLNEILP